MNTQEGSIGENLKVIRQYFKLKQSEIAGNTMTRNLISLIENDKTPILEKTALSIVTNINAIMESRHSNARITVNDLMTPGIFGAKQEADRLMAHLDNYGHEHHFNLDGYLQKMNAFYATWDIPDKKYHNYFQLGLFFERRNELERANLYYLRAYENAIHISPRYELGEIAVKLTSLSFLLYNFDSIIMFSEVLKSYGTDINHDNMVKTIMHEAYAHYTKGNYERGIDVLLQAEHYIPKDQPSLSLDVQLLKTELYIEKGMLGIGNRILKNLRYQFPSDYSSIDTLIEAASLYLRCHLNGSSNLSEDYQMLLSRIHRQAQVEMDMPLVKAYSFLAQSALKLEVFESYLDDMEKVLAYYMGIDDQVHFAFYLTRILKAFENQHLDSLKKLQTYIDPYIQAHFISKDSGIYKKLLELSIQFRDFDFADLIISLQK